MQVPLWRKTAISSCTEIMDKEFHAWLSESLCRDFFLYEITFFYVFDLCNTFSSVINECMQKIESDCHQKERVQFKDQDFLALLKSLHVKNFIEKKSSWYDMRPLNQIGLVRKLEVVQKQVGGCLMSYNLQLACSRRLEDIWPDESILTHWSL